MSDDIPPFTPRQMMAGHDLNAEFDRIEPIRPTPTAPFGDEIVAMLEYSGSLFVATKSAVFRGLPTGASAKFRRMKIEVVDD